MNNSKYDVLKLENQLCFPLYACSREIIKKYRPFLDKLGITYTQYIVLMVLWDKKRINVKELGKMLYLDSGTLTPVLKSLAAKGFVRRYRSSEDERVLFIEITESGELLKEKAVLIPQKIAVCIDFAQTEAAQLYTLLYKVLNSLK